MTHDLQEQFYTCIPYDGSEPFHISIKKMSKLLEAEPHLFTPVEGPLTPDFIDYLLKEQGVEECALEAITPDAAEIPGFAILWDGLYQIIDGNHRAVKRYRLGLNTFKCWGLPMDIALERCRMEFPDGFDKIMEQLTRDKVPTRQLMKEAGKSCTYE